MKLVFLTLFLVKLFIISTTTEKIALLEKKINMKIQMKINYELNDIFDYNETNLNDKKIFIIVSVQCNEAFYL